MTDWQPEPQNPEQVADGLRNAMRQAKEDGVFETVGPSPMKKQTDRVLALCIGVVVVGFLYLLAALIAGPSAPTEKFKVVDTYKGCEVVKYYPKGDARAAYLLDCTGVRSPAP